MADREVGAKLRAELARLTSLNPFEVLRISPEATTEEVRAAYLVATKAYHPNRFARENPDAVEAANEVFLVIRRAYGVLCDDAKRKAAQQKLAGTAPTPPRIRAGAPSLDAAPAPAVQMPSPPTIPSAPTARAPGTQPPSAKIPPTQPPLATPRKIPPTQPPRAERTPPPLITPRTPSTQPPRGPGAAAATPRPRPPVVPAQPQASAGPASTTTRPVSPQTGRSPEEVNALLEATKTRPARFDQALKHLVRNRLQEARTLLEQLVREDASTKKYRVRLHHVMALELRDAGRVDDAVKELERAIAIDPEFPDLKVELDKLRSQNKGLFSRLFRS